MTGNLISPRHILDTAFAFRRSMTLLTAVELGLFGALAEQPRAAKSLAQMLGMHGRGSQDFFDALVSLKLLVRDPAGFYSNTAETARFLDPRSDEFIGHALDRLSTRVYNNWNKLAEALRTGEPQSGSFGRGGYQALYADDVGLQTFLRAMSGTSMMLARALAATFPWEKYEKIVDIGTAEGCIPVQLTRSHPHLRVVGYDLPAVEGSFRRYVERKGLPALVFHGGDFLSDALPRGDVLIMSRILHNWDLRTKQRLLRKAYESLGPGGVLIVCETLIDDARRNTTDALFSSLHMLIETSEGYEATGADYIDWMKNAGFANAYILETGCAQSAIVGTKA